MTRYGNETMQVREVATPYGDKPAEVEIRYRRIQRAPAGPIAGPSQAAAVLSPLVVGLDQERMWIMHLDTGNNVIGVQEIARGRANSVNVSPREVFRSALVVGAVAVILAHNHPSGSLKASQDDHELTRRITEAVKLISPVALEDKTRFAIREGGRTVGAGVVTKIIK
jgi:DNA repair protein RadC